MRNLVRVPIKLSGLFFIHNLVLLLSLIKVAALHLAIVNLLLWPSCVIEIGII